MIFEICKKIKAQTVIYPWWDSLLDVFIIINDLGDDAFCFMVNFSRTIIIDLVAAIKRLQLIRTLEKFSLCVTYLNKALQKW